jgi:hypothetical protein
MLQHPQAMVCMWPQLVQQLAHLARPRAHHLTAQVLQERAHGQILPAAAFPTWRAHLFPGNLRRPGRAV